MKSLLGERLTWSSVGPEGLLHDREYAVFDTETGLGLTGRREPKLLFLSSESTDNGHGLLIRNEKGKRLVDDKALVEGAGSLGRVAASRLRRHAYLRSAARCRDRSRRLVGVVERSPRRIPRLDAARVCRWCRARRPASGIPRRFRSNVVLDGAGEDELVGQRIRIGDVVLDVTKQIDRCVMVTRPQGNGIDRNLDVLKTINHDRAGNLAIGALVIEPGVIRLGDTVEV